MPRDKGKPKVSILIPVYNRAKIILETLNSAIDQTYENIEVIVVDNKSTDNTFEVVKEFAESHSNVRVYQNEEDIGPVRNWRRCLDYATGEYVKILWSDDLIDPTFVEKTLPYLVAYENVGFVFTGAEIFNDDTGQRGKAYFIGDTGIYDTKKFIEGSLLRRVFPVSPGNALFRKKDVKKNLVINIPNEIGIDFKIRAIGNDLLIYLLTAKDYPKFAFVDETLSFFRAHEGSITTYSNGSELTMLYHIAEAYFVENYLADDKLRKKFNTKLWIFLLRTGKNMGIRKIQDFYSNEDQVDLDYLFLGKLILGKLLSKFHKIIYLVVCFCLRPMRKMPDL